MSRHAASLCLCLACVSATPPPIPRQHKATDTATKGAGAAALLTGIKAKPAVTAGPTLRTNVFVWRYPSQIVPSNYWWNLLTATNALGPWTVAISNASGILTVTNHGEALRLWRLQGRLTP